MSALKAAESDALSFSGQGAYGCCQIRGALEKLTADCLCCHISGFTESVQTRMQGRDDRTEGGRGRRHAAEPTA